MPTNSPELHAITARLPQFLPELLGLKELIIANAVMVGEIPAPTGNEEKRMRFLLDRFTESGLQSISHDEAGNTMALVPGHQPDYTTLVLAHADTPVPGNVDHTLRVDQDKITGPGIADNGIGLATVATLPMILQRMGIQLKENLLLLAVSRSLGEGDLAGLRFFLENNRIPIRTGICLEGDRLGRLTHKSLGSLRGEVSVQIHEDTALAYPHRPGAVDILAQLACKFREVYIPDTPKTNVTLGSLHSGSTFSRNTRSGTLRFDITSEDLAVVERIKEQFQQITHHFQQAPQANVRLDIIGRRNPGGLDEDHPLVQTQASILEAHDINPVLRPTGGDLSALTEHNLPALTLGLTHCENFQEPDEAIHIQPLFPGISQLICLLLAIDQNLCHDGH